MIAFGRSGPRPSWTAADYDSYEVLAAAGVRRPAARVTRARSPRMVRQAVRAALRNARCGLRWATTEPQHTAAN